MRRSCALLIRLKGKILLTDHIEASSVAVEAHVLRRDLHVVVGVNAVRAGKETKQARLRVELLDHVEEAHDDVVAAGSLTTGQDTAKLKSTNKAI